MDKKTAPLNFPDRADMLVKLILDDMKISRLLHGMSQTGMDISSFQPRICEVIFALAFIRIEDENKLDKLKDWYFSKIKGSFVFEITHERQLHKIASNILLGLLNWKEPEAPFGSDL